MHVVCARFIMPVCNTGVLHGSAPMLGNCDICAKQKISFINEMRQNFTKTKSEGPGNFLLNTVNFH